MQKEKVTCINQRIRKGEDVREYDLCFTLNKVQGGGQVPLIKIPEATAQGYAVAKEGDSINLSNPHSKTRRGRVGVANTLDARIQQYTPVIYDDYNSKVRKDGLTCTITGNTGASALRTGQKLIQNMSIRRLTPTECERLQGFPDSWTKYGHDGKEISDSQRYKMLGNAVSVPVVKAVMMKLFPIKEGEK